MSRKHFEALAAGFRNQAEALRAASGNCMTPDRVQLALNVLRDAAEVVAYVSASSNPNFDRTRFLSACGF